jgi:HAD superfamily hydrolase (TIGR01457 family)
MMSTAPQTIWQVPGEIRGFLLDLDGTLYLGNRLIPGADQFIEQLRESGRRCLFLTNNSSRSSEGWAEKLRGMGIDASAADVFASGEATAAYLAEHRPDARVYLLGTPGLEAELKEHGVHCVQDAPDLVLVGFDMGLTYEKLRKACRFLLSGAELWATHPDRVCPTQDGPIPDTGSFLALIESATGKVPDLVVGKPNLPMVEGALHRLGLNAEEVAMVGDRLYTDMAMARAGGLTGVLVLSGESTLAMLNEAPPEHQPEVVLESVRSAKF